MTDSIENHVAAMNWGAVPQTRASDRARELILARIFTGELGPGDRLPTERELAAELGIARLTLREALKSLEAAGYLVTKVGARGGTRVNEAVALTRCFKEWLRLKGDRLNDLIETQGIIETAIASLAAERRTETDLERLAAALPSADDPRRLMQERHTEFHEALARAAHNDWLQAIDSSIRGQIFIPLDHLMNDEESERFKVGMHDHHALILAAVRDKDPARAAAEMERHLRDPEAWRPLHNDRR